jgi:hypothetical protein
VLTEEVPPDLGVAIPRGHEVDHDAAYPGGILSPGEDAGDLVVADVIGEPARLLEGIRPEKGVELGAVRLMEEREIRARPLRVD